MRCRHTLFVTGRRNARPKPIRSVRARTPGDLERLRLRACAHHTPAVTATGRAYQTIGIERLKSLSFVNRDGLKFHAIVTQSTSSIERSANSNTEFPTINKGSFSWNPRGIQLGTLRFGFRLTTLLFC